MRHLIGILILMVVFSNCTGTSRDVVAPPVPDEAADETSSPISLDATQTSTRAELALEKGAKVTTTVDP